MRWRLLGPVLALLLLAAVVFSLWPTAPLVSSTPEPAPVPPIGAQAPLPTAPRDRPRDVPVAPSTPVAPPTTSPVPPSTTAVLPRNVAGPTADDRATRSDSKPSVIEDAGVVHALTRDGIKAAIQGELPQIRACYESWLAQQPDLGGKLKVQFTIVEVPGEPVGRVEQIDTADGGLGHLVFEGCVKNVFAGLRFERPPDGVMKVTWPLAFENTTARPP